MNKEKGKHLRKSKEILTKIGAKTISKRHLHKSK